MAKLNPVVVIPVEIAPVPSPDGAPPPGSPPPPDGAPPPPGSGPAPGPAGPNNNPNGPPPANQPPPQGGGQQPKPGETKTANDNKAGPSLGAVLSMINTNQNRIGNETKAVVQAAESAAAKDAQQAQAQAETVAGALTAQSVTSSLATTGTTTTQTTMASQVSAISIANATQDGVINIGGLRAPTQSMFAEPSVSMNNNVSIGSTEMYSLQAPQGRNATAPEPEVLPNEGIKLGTRSVLNDAIEQRPIAQNTNSQEQKTDTVNRNAQPNELAGKVDIASMATQPQGYQAYSLAMPDVAFYAPREIYRNQVNVDNVRLFRGLGSDRLHQQMIDMQYK
jgi:hypothetical protein